MNVKFKKGKQNYFIQKAIDKVGSEKRLSKITDIPNSTIHDYKKEVYNIPLERLSKILKILNLSVKDVDQDIEDFLDPNWGAIKGGNNRIKKLKDEGKYEAYLKKFKRTAIKTFKRWHKNMKKNNKKRYHEIQYNRFKRIGSYKFVTKNGERVRNKLEKTMADLLYLNNIDYKYEPYLEVNNKVYFPDFMIGKKIIECTMWRGYLKVNKLKKKIQDFEKARYQVRIIITEDVEKFYKVISNYLSLDPKEIIAWVA